MKELKIYQYDNELIKHVLQRCEKKENDTTVAGIEVRNRRLQSGRTLYSLSADSCSVSYLSKFENNKLTPTAPFLREICNRVDLTEAEIDTIISSGKTIYSCMLALRDGESKEINEAFKASENLSNYRSEIIRLIYYIAHNKLAKAMEIGSSLLELSSVMADDDLMIYTLLMGILAYQRGEFTRALDELTVLRRCNLEPVIALRDRYIFLSKLALNDSDTLIEYERAYNEALKTAHYKMCDTLNYYAAIYCAKNGLLEYFNSLLYKITDEGRRSSCIIMYEFFNGLNIDLELVEDSRLNQFARAIVELKRGNEDLKRKLQKLNINTYSPECDYAILRALSVDGDDKNDFIIRAVKHAKLTGEKFVVSFLINEYAKNTINKGRYKKFAELFLDCAKDNLI